MTRAAHPFPDESLTLALQSDAVLLGAVGGVEMGRLDYSVRPERALGPVEKAGALRQPAARIGL